jgi:hypothetical protein
MKNILLIILSVLLITTSSYANSFFSDIEENVWYKDWVNDLIEQKITSGYPDGTFRPDNQLKRIELLSFTMKSLGYDLAVSEGYWGQNIIDKAVEINIIEETDLMVLNPDGYITREETAQVIYSAYKVDHTKYNDDVKAQVKLMIKDINSVNEKYLEGVIGVFAEGIVEGYEDQSFRPDNNLTRAEASVFISRLALEDKRAAVDFEMPSFEYFTESTTSTDFKIYYDEKYQDLYNIMAIVDTIENEDVENGYAWISDLSPNEHYHSVKLYTNVDDFDYAPTVLHANYKRWDMDLRYEDHLSPYIDFISILSWRDENLLEHEPTMKAVFNYLFEDESELIWSKYMKFTNNGGQEATWNYVTSNGRNIFMGSGAIGVGLDVSRIDYASLIYVNDYKEVD